MPAKEHRALLTMTIQKEISAKSVPGQRRKRRRRRRERRMSYRCGMAPSMAQFGFEPGPPRIICDGCGVTLEARTRSGGPPAWLLDQKAPKGWKLILRPTDVEEVQIREDYCPKCKGTTKNDYVVTVPKNRWRDWLDEGDLPGDASTGQVWGFFLGGNPPRNVEPGDRLYIVAHGRLRGWSPIISVEPTDRGFAFCRRAGAVACTIDEPIKGFRGYRKRWWKREDEKPFPDWKTAEVKR
jgi:hypothetical protein